MNREITFLLIILIIIILVAVGVTVSNRDDNGGQGNGNGADKGKRWDDLYKFKKFLNDNYTVTEKPDSNTDLINDIDDPEDAVWIVIGVEKEFTSRESSAVRNFVDEGGIFILAAESTLANKISRQFAVEYSTHRIIETEKYDANEMFVPTNAYLGGKNYHILTNAPIGLEFDEKVTTIEFNVIAESSSNTGLGDFSFLDTNDDGTADANDVLGPIDMIIEVQFGKGKLIFIGDSGIFTDNLWDRTTSKAVYENNKFCDTLLKYSVSRQGTVIYDFSKHENFFSGHKQYPL